RWPVRWSVFCRRTRCSDVSEKSLGR
ncbi:TPA: phage tail assembly protein, partial [Escherichia coli]|nr:phage tail assembly protein [Escherichia coli]HAG7472469.1 phage tail assembly protein [Escherichia coli]HAG7488112.1 phage tail assembly protein [Escherichia coli]HAG7838260.1 phage tail assembly protein [Escherichia coli]HAH3556140.1 phage tail assembly protein [Escherichia coli]